jgi:hypothetical protein
MLSGAKHLVAESVRTESPSALTSLILRCAQDGCNVGLRSIALLALILEAKKSQTFYAARRASLQKATRSNGKAPTLPSCVEIAPAQFFTKFIQLHPRA